MRITYSQLADAFRNYTGTYRYARDPVFYAAMRAVAPTWFVRPMERSAINKQRLLAMARAGEPRPDQRTHMGSALCRYMHPTHCQDPVFVEQLRAIRPDWLPWRKRRTV